MPLNGQRSPSPAPPASSDNAVAGVAMAASQTAECSASGRSVFQRLGNRSAVQQAMSASEKSTAQNEMNSAMTDDEDGEMTGSTSEEEQGSKNVVPGGRILSLRTVVGNNSISGRPIAANRLRRSPIIYDQPPDDQQENRSGSSSNPQPVRSGSRTARQQHYGQYEKSRVLEADGSSLSLETRRRRSSTSSTQQHDRQRSASLTPPHLRHTNGLKYDRHGNLRRTAAVAIPSSSSPHSPPHYGSSSRSYGSRQRSSPSESLHRSYAYPPAASKFETYRQYFDDFRRRSDRPIREEDSEAATSHPRISSHRSVPSALHSDSLAEPEFGCRKRMPSGSSRASYKQSEWEEDESGSNFMRKSQSMAEKRRREESERVNDGKALESGRVSSSKAESAQEIEEGEEFSDWSAADAEDGDEDLDSISSTDELLAHILITNHQSCPQTAPSESQKDQDDGIQPAEQRKSSYACTSSADLTESWKRLVSTQPSTGEANSSSGKTFKAGRKQGEAGAALVLQSYGFSSKLLGHQLIQDLDHFIRIHCNRRNSEPGTTSPIADTSCQVEAD